MTAVMLFGGAALAVAILAGRLSDWARRQALLAIPNERSSHVQPTPTGAGLAIVLVTIAGFLLSEVFARSRTDPALIWVLAGSCGLALVGWYDDRRGAPVWLRLIVQAAGAVLLLAVSGAVTRIDVPVSGAIALGAAGTLLTLVWVIGLTNAYNFMDGIDGIAGTQGLVAGLAWGVAGMLAGIPSIAAAGWLVAGASLGFLRHNWAPADVFMGDVGSVFLGYLFAALAVLAAHRDPAFAIFGVAVVWPFVVDTAFTCLRRLSRGENVFKAHRSHLYQRLVVAGWSHKRVTFLYGAAAIVCSLAGLAYVQRWPAGPELVAIVLPGVGVALWLMAASEERRGRRTLVASQRHDVPAFAHPIRNRYILLADVLLIAFSAAAAFSLRFDWLFVYSRPEFPTFLGVVLIVKPLVFFAFGLYKRYWRYASVWDLVAVVLAVSAAEIVVSTIMVGTIWADIQRFQYATGFARSVLPIDWLVTLTCAGGVRMSVRVFGESAQGRVRRASDAAPKRVLIVGAGEAGILVLREIRYNPQLQMHVAGFLDDDPVKLGKRIHGVTVLGELSTLVAVASAHKVDEVVIALPTAAGTVVRSVIDSCREAGIQSRAMPGVFELLDGRVSISKLRDVEIGDLLRRSQVASRPDAARYVSGETVLVTGAGGSIGSELCHQIARNGPARIVLVGHGETSIFAIQNDLREHVPGLPVEAIIADLRDAVRLQQIMDRVRPATVFHAAAHKHVPLMEVQPQEAITNNVFGTLNVVNAAVRSGVERLVLISTDKAVSPTSVMGATKRIAEAIVRDAARRHSRAFVVVRFGNVLGSRGSVVPIFKRQIERGGPILITHPDMKRFFMTIPEAVHLVLQAGGLGRGGELFVLDMGEPVRIVDLAQDLIRLSGCELDEIPITFTGLRPGEKLEESLWEAGAAVEPTDNPDVLRVAEIETSREDLTQSIGLLQSAVETGDRVALLFALSACVPSFVPAGQPQTGQPT